MKQARGLIEGADPNAVGAAPTVILHPVPQALLSIDRPFEYACIIGDADGLISRLSEGDGSPGAVISTTCTDTAEFGHTEINRLIRNQR